MVTRLPQSMYQAFSEGIDTLIYSLSGQESDLRTLEEEVAASQRGVIGSNDMLRISGASREELTAALRDLHERVYGPKMQLPLPFTFDEPAELKSQP